MEETIADLQELSQGRLMARYRKAIQRIRKAWPKLSLANIKEQIRRDAAPCCFENGKLTLVGKVL